MFLVVQSDTINIHDISRLSREGRTIIVYFISGNTPATYHYETDSDASEVQYKIFKSLEEKKLVV